MILCRTLFSARTERLESIAFVGRGFAANTKKLSVDRMFAAVYNLSRGQPAMMRY